MLFRQIFDPRLSQYAYLIGCQRSGEAIVIDPQRDVDRYIDAAAEEDLRIVATAETHIHADFLSGSRELAHKVGAKVYASGLGGPDWQVEWLDHDDDVDFHRLADGDSIHIGNIELKAVYSPGHTPEHVSYLVTDHGGGATEPMGIASGDFVFVGDLGRPDLLESAAGEAGAMEPSARRLFASASSFMDLPDHLQVWPGHGAGSACGKALGAVPMSTVGYEKRHNASLDAVRRGEDAFVAAILDGQPEPPVYFARMKTLNRTGAPVLGELPRPERLTDDELKALVAAGNDGSDAAPVILDTRHERADFLDGHLPGSLCVPLDRTFPTVAGSYVRPEQSIYLIADEHEVEDAVRELIRIGLDNVKGWAPPSALESSGIELEAIESVGLDAAQEAASGALALDVRRAVEFREGAVDGALNIAHTRLAARLDEIPKGRPLNVYCQTGIRAAVAAAYLKRQGFEVRRVEENFPAWSSARSRAGAATSVTAS